jgi:hypothetical protein
MLGRKRDHEEAKELHTLAQLEGSIDHFTH